MDKEIKSINAGFASGEVKMSLNTLSSEGGSISAFSGNIVIHSLSFFYDTIRRFPNSIKQKSAQHIPTVSAFSGN
jgi:hypothetical protein